MASRNLHVMVLMLYIYDSNKTAAIVVIRMVLRPLNSNQSDASDLYTDCPIKRVQASKMCSGAGGRK
jgi:hypothetical protein